MRRPSRAPPGPGSRSRAQHTLLAVAADRLEKLQQTTRYVPAEAEARVLAAWLESGIFHPEPGGTPDENYSIAVPPPNVTGELHMGHALNGSIQDTLIRMRRMQGRRTKWIFGTDHAGIATQVKVEQLLEEEGASGEEVRGGGGGSREEIGREEFVKRVWEWREKYGSQIVEQFQRLGASADYED